jgi:menaquinone-dependent protoporphyrinogen IX oxidase
MKAVVLYQSRTGNTQRAGELIAHELLDQGHEVALRPVSKFDYHELSIADIIFVGTWTDGIVIAGHRPGQVGRIRALPNLGNKLVATYATYALHAGKMPQKMREELEAKDAVVIASEVLHRKKLGNEVPAFVATAMSELNAMSDRA